MKKIELNSEYQTANSFAVQLTGEQYVKLKLQYFIESHAKYGEFADPETADSWTQVYRLILNEILNNFTPYELWRLSFFDPCLYENSCIDETKEDFIEEIKIDPIFTELECQLLEKKVKDMPNVVFGLIINLIQISDLFNVDEMDDFGFRDLENIENKRLVSRYSLIHLMLD